MPGDAILLGDADPQAAHVAGERRRPSPGTARSAEVLSMGSWPAMAWSSSAQSSTVRAIGPAWSSELANATMPQREQRP